MLYVVYLANLSFKSHKEYEEEKYEKGENTMEKRRGSAGSATAPATRPQHGDPSCPLMATRGREGRAATNRLSRSQQ